MAALGAYLRAERERRGITLEQLQDGTKIRLKYLKAIEEEQFHEMPGEVYLKGFLRSYAEFIGLDGAQVVKRYQDLKREAPVEPDANRVEQRKQAVPSTHRTSSSLSPADDGSPRRDLPAKERTAARSRRRARRSRVLGVAIAALFLAVAGSALIYRAVVGPSDSSKPAQTVQTRAEAPVPAHVPRTQPAQVGQNREAVSASPSSLGQGQGAVLKAVRVTTEGRARSWIRVSEDGKLAFQGFLAKGQRREWTALKGVEITFTNAGGVLVTHNDSQLGVVGETGRVVTRIFGPGVRGSSPDGRSKGAGQDVRRSPGTNASLGEPNPPSTRVVAPRAVRAAGVQVTAQPLTAAPKPAVQQIAPGESKATDQVKVLEAPPVTSQPVEEAEQEAAPVAPVEPANPAAPEGEQAPAQAQPAPVVP